MEQGSNLDMDESLNKQSDSSKSIPAIDISRITGEVEEPKKDFADIHCFLEEELGNENQQEEQEEIEEGEIVEKSGERTTEGKDVDHG